MRILAAVIVLGAGIAALIGCAGASGELHIGCRGTCSGCSSDSDCCSGDSCFFTFPFGEGRCASSPGEC